MNRIALLSLSLFVSIFIQAQSNLEITKEGFSEVLKEQEKVSCSVNGLGLKISLNEDFMKYDKVEILIYESTPDGKYKPIATSYTHEYHPIFLEFYPQSKAFKDNFEGSKVIEKWLFEASNDGSIGYKSYFCGSFNPDLSYKVFADGYFEGEREMKWSEKSQSYKEVQRYELSKTFMESLSFSFLMDEQTKMQIESTSRYEKIKDICSKEIDVPYVGVTQPRIKIFEAYDILRNDYKAKNKQEEINNVEEKLLQLLKKPNNNKMKKKLKEETNPDAIYEIIMNS